MAETDVVMFSKKTNSIYNVVGVSVVDACCFGIYLLCCTKYADMAICLLLLLTSFLQLLSRYQPYLLNILNFLKKPQRVFQ
jgi:hypothetical protein